MIFSSFEFAVFFATLTPLYFLTPPRARWALLLVASCGFYMAFVPIYILILAFTIAVDYVSGIQIAAREGAARKRFLAMSLATNLAVLGVFKYFNFLMDSVSWLTLGLFDERLPRLDLLLPIGLSFHTFQAMAYTIEVYRGRVEPERHLGYFALYVMFYPQLVAGPIERPQSLLPQLRAHHVFEYERVAAGLVRMGIGLFKKMAIADPLAVVGDSVYASPHEHSGLALIIATLFLPVQIYCDFSGYSDVAFGAAQVMGVTLTRNFRAPLIAPSLAQLWRRWHISLTSWFRDYVYIPLGGNRVSRGRQALNIVIVFVLSGLWHGAGATYVVFGLFNGLLVALGTLPIGARFLGSRTRSAPLSVATSYLSFAFGLIFFRSRTLDDAWHVVRHLHAGLGADLQGFWAGGTVAGLSLPMLFGIVCVLALFLKVDALDAQSDIVAHLRALPFFVRWAAYFALVYSSLIAGSFHSGQPYIYFQF